MDFSPDYSLLAHYCLHMRSYSRENNRRAVICKLLDSLNKGRIEEDELKEYLDLLERIGKDIWGKETQIEAEILFEKLMKELEVAKDLKKYAACRFFCEKVFWHKNACSHIVMHFLKI